jgi:hypothetical protein
MLWRSPTRPPFCEHVGTTRDAFQSAREDLLGVTETVGGGRVDPIDTEVEGTANGGDGLPVILRTPAEFPIASTDGPGAETEGVMFRSVVPSFRVSMRTLSTRWMDRVMSSAEAVDNLRSAEAYTIKDGWSG